MTWFLNRCYWDASPSRTCEKMLQISFVSCFMLGGSLLRKKSQSAYWAEKSISHHATALNLSCFGVAIILPPHFSILFFLFSSSQLGYHRWFFFLTLADSFCLLPLIKNTVYCCLWGSHAQGEGICTVDTHFCRQWSRRHCRAYDLRHFHVSGFERFRHFFHIQNLRDFGFPISKSTYNRGCHVLHRGNLPHTCYSDKPH